MLRQGASQPERAHAADSFHVHVLRPLRQPQAFPAAAALRLDELRCCGRALRGASRTVTFHPRRDVDRVAVNGVLATAVRSHQAPAHRSAVHPGKQAHGPLFWQVDINRDGGSGMDGFDGEDGEPDGVVCGLRIGEMAAM